MQTFTVFLIICFLLIIWFFAGWRINIDKAVKYAERLERIFKPVEKKYTWIGGAIGFHAEYKTKKGDFFVTCLLLPRHAALWLPVSLLIRKGDLIRVKAKETEVEVIAKAGWEKEIIRFLQNI